MDSIGLFIANLHGLIGHDKTAAFIGQPSGDRDNCVLCQYERRPDRESRLAVIQALSRNGRKRK